MTPFSITPFKLADLSALLRLERDIFPEDTFGMAEFLSLYLRGKETFLVAREGRRVVGYVAGYADGEIAYIASVAVDPAFRGRGLGRLLMETVMRRLVGAGVAAIGLHVREDNLAAIRLYESLGFVALESLADYYEDGTNGLYMERPSVSAS